MRTLLMTTAAAIFAAGAAVADDADVVVLIDADADGVITMDEWNASRAETTGVFGEWNTNEDGILSRDEYVVGLQMAEDNERFGTWDEYYADWDVDQDAMLTQDEYDTGLFDVYDADDDDVWSEDEVKAWEEDELRYDATRAGREVSRR